MSSDSRARPDPVPAGTFRVADALAAGATPRMLRRRSLAAPARGIRMPVGDLGDVRERCRALSLLLPGDAGFSHATAAALWGLPVPRGVDPLVPVHVVGPVGRPPLDADGVARHEGARPQDLVRRDGIPLTTPARLLADVAASWSDVDLVVLADAVLGRARPRTARAELDAVCAGWAGRRGARALRTALARSRHFVDSPMETLTRLRLVDSGFPCPVVGADVVDDRGCWIARPDMCWPGIRVAIEYDGEHHRTDRWQYAKDIHRKEQLEDAGWRCIVLLADDVLRRWSATVSRVEDVFSARGVHPSELAPAPDARTRPRVLTRSRWT